jgi:hypothetical protein
VEYHGGRDAICRLPDPGNEKDVEKQEQDGEFGHDEADVVDDDEDILPLEP